ncbi:MAG: DnaJ domain-containing protein [Myxococcales bacterium]|nr:DnaJ domain-containing protein [Myxococcales bacterium]
MSAPRPIASGVLSKTPLSNLLVYILDRELSGTLVLETQDGAKSALAFVRGVPAKARTSDPVIYLGRLLMEQGLIDDNTESLTLSRVASERKLFGQLLIEQGALTREQLIKSLQEQVSRKVEWMCGLPPTTAYGFYQDVDFLQGYGGEPTPIRPLAALWRGVRRFGPDALVESSLERLGQRPLRFHPDAAIKKFGLNSAESSVIDVIRAKSQPISGLLRADLIDTQTLKRLVFVLFITRHLDLGEGTGDPIGGEAGPASSRRPEPSRPRGEARQSKPDSTPAETQASELSPEAKELRREVMERFAIVDKQNYYEMLGVPETSGTTDIQAAFFQLAKRFHPDKVSAQLPALREQVNKVFARISEAHQVLTDDERRTEYERLMREGGASADEQEKVQQVLRAAQSFQKAEVLFKKRDLQAAAELAKKASEDDPEQADYLAFYAWVTSQLPERLEQNGYQDLIQLLDRCVAQEPDNLRCRWYRGQLHKRADNVKAAIKDFRWVLEKNPRHVDAQREVRLYEMRRQTGHSVKPPGAAPKASSPPGKGLNSDIGQIWGKLFKKDK